MQFWMRDVPERVTLVNILQKSVFYHACQWSALACCFVQFVYTRHAIFLTVGIFYCVDISFQANAGKISYLSRHNEVALDIWPRC